MCVCPFHDDKNPSMKVDRRFHCFGCQADGDVIDFVSRLENVSPKKPPSCWRRTSPSLMRTGSRQAGATARSQDKGRKARNSNSSAWSATASGYCPTITILLRRWMLGLCPQRRRRKHGTPLFVEALQKQSHVEYLLDVLLFSDMEERAALIASYGKGSEEP